MKFSFRCCRAARRSARRSPRGSSAAPRARGRARRPAGSSAPRARPAPRAGAARPPERRRLQVKMLGEGRPVGARPLERRGQGPDLGAGHPAAQLGDRVAQRSAALDLGDRAPELERQGPAGPGGDLARPVAGSRPEAAPTASMSSASGSAATNRRRRRRASRSSRASGARKPAATKPSPTGSPGERGCRRGRERDQAADRRAPSFAATTARGAIRPPSPARSRRAAARPLAGLRQRARPAGGHRGERRAGARAEPPARGPCELPRGAEGEQHRDRGERRRQPRSTRLRRLIAANPPSCSAALAASRPAEAGCGEQPADEAR